VIKAALIEEDIVEGAEVPVGGEGEAADDESAEDASNEESKDK